MVRPHSCSWHRLDSLVSFRVARLFGKGLPAWIAPAISDLDPDGLAVASKTVEIIARQIKQARFTFRLRLLSFVIVYLCARSLLVALYYPPLPPKLILSHCRRHYHQGLTLVVYFQTLLWPSAAAAPPRALPWRQGPIIHKNNNDT